jgi:phage terminase Nu1 subunit (DNA packaging protein)
MHDELSRLVKIGNDKQILISTKGLCSVLGVSKMTISKWAKQGMPKRGIGWWCLADVIAWRDSSTGDTTGEIQNKSLNARKLEADAQYKEVKAEKEEILLNALKGQYIERDAIVREWTERVLNLKKSLLMLPKLIAAEFINVEISAQVEEKTTDYVHDFLNEYARKGKYTPQKGDRNEPK